jgi:hypothetical protein
MDRITLYIPETLNDGSSVGQELFDCYEAALLDLTTDAAETGGQGFTLTHAIGGWRSPSGVLFRETMRLYAVDVEDASSIIDAVHALAHTISRELGQEAVYITLTPISTHSFSDYVSV